MFFVINLIQLAGSGGIKFRFSLLKPIRKDVFQFFPGAIGYVAAKINQTMGGQAEVAKCIRLRLDFC